MTTEVWVAAERSGTPYHRIASTHQATHGADETEVTIVVAACERHSYTGAIVTEAVAIVRGYKPCTRCFTEGVVR